MTIRLTHETKPLKAKKYVSNDGIEMTFAINREEYIRLWNERRFERFFDRITNDATEERRNIRPMLERVGRTDAGNNRNGRTRRTTPRFV